MIDKLLKIIELVIAKDATAIEKIKDYINSKENNKEYDCDVIRCPMCGAMIDKSSVCQSDDLDELLDGNILVIKSQ